MAARNRIPECNLNGARESPGSMVMFRTFYGVIHESLTIWREGRHRNFSLTFNCDGQFVGIMILSGGRAKRLSQLEGKTNYGKYGSLQMYKVPPIGNITLEEFEEFAIARLKGDFT